MQASPPSDRRRDLLDQWLALRYPGFTVSTASADASFRRYFRLRRDGESLILMDAPPQHLDCRPFILAAQRFAALGLHVPQVLEADLRLGFLVLSDLGDRSYLAALGPENVDELYLAALSSLLTLQTRGHDEDAFPPYDQELIERELRIFDEWLLGRLLGVSLDESERRELEGVYAQLCANALAQPRVWVHRDYHSRNLMVCGQLSPGILDFQDALVGPVTYDLVSLLRDCYVAWPERQVEAWSLGHRQALLESGFAGVGPNQETWLRWLDLMGVQRHLKAAGIFARLWLRDGKSGYLADIPRTLGYVGAVSKRHRDLAPLIAIMDRHVAGRLESVAACG